VFPVFLSAARVTYPRAARMRHLNGLLVVMGDFFMCFCFFVHGAVIRFLAASSGEVADRNQLKGNGNVYL